MSYQNLVDGYLRRSGLCIENRPLDKSDGGIESNARHLGAGPGGDDAYNYNQFGGGFSRDGSFLRDVRPPTTKELSNDN